ncbi:EamA family transporter [Saccharibacter sp. 17.LH.SD]|uniref:DMT family transporter n=1 Tax=Saccharibacter sp. 17.LH.SD TaxID=2689393 RepID=UPI00136DA0DB|nr:EamA family transporter [Saccharibacter sp. 17.LH.SD]MXV45041.1 EamA family transporter [Saccharibacter sp. 17.LH.SD]
MTPLPRQYLSGLLAVICASIIWGSIGIAANMASQVAPMTMGAAAMAGGGFLQAISAVSSIQRSLSNLRPLWGYVLLGGLAVAIDPLAFYTSMHLAGVAASTVVALGSAPLFSAVIDTVMDRSKLGIRWGVSAFLGIAGITALSFAETHGAHQTAPAPLLGIFLALIMGFTYAFYSWAAHRLMHRHIPARAAMGSIFGVGALFLTPFLIITGGALLHPWHNIAVSLYLAVIPMFCGFTLFGYGLRFLPASIATTITLLEPTIAAILATTLLGEHLSLTGWLGIVTIMASLLCVTWPGKSAVTERD